MRILVLGLLGDAELRVAVTAGVLDVELEVVAAGLGALEVVGVGPLRAVLFAGLVAATTDGRGHTCGQHAADEHEQSNDRGSTSAHYLDTLPVKETLRLYFADSVRGPAETDTFVRNRPGRPSAGSSRISTYAQVGGRRARPGLGRARGGGNGNPRCGADDRRGLSLDAG